MTIFAQQFNNCGLKVGRG